MGEFVEEEEEKMCRYCFEGAEAGELINPCECKGGQRWVHLECLRRWQRMVLVSQPTHPMFHGDELRHQSCGICKTEFTCRPPTRHELMTSFTGPEIAALIDVGCVIGAGEEFSVELEAQLGAMPAAIRAASSYDHWLRSAYLITDVEDDDGLVSLDADSEDELSRLREAVDRESLLLALRGKRLQLIARGALANSGEDLATAFFEEIRAPATFFFQLVDERGRPAPRTCGDDHVAAVNLCRPLPRAWDSVRARRVLARAYDAIEKGRGKAWAARCRSVEVVHHLGGPCDEREVVKCLVLGATKRGYKIIKDLGEAVFLAARLAIAKEDSPKRKMGEEDPRDDRIGPGQRVKLRNLTKNPDLNDRTAIVVRRQAQRWLVRVAESEDLRLVAARPENLLVDDHPRAWYPEKDDDDDDDQEDVVMTRPFRGRVYAFWGDARWSRTQLLGEIARGHWGMCRESLAEIIAPPAARRDALDDRLIFAPLSAMTEDSIARARTQMLPLREQARLAAAAVRRDASEDYDTPDARPASSESAPSDGN
ncbi:hypothetical protein CTAYLR_001113 [Chrysophaeum taylorii]|uniref:RING-CH-type domain-containing protein n=1 Tax=Chrysophaeum taylorii TaxID=2483200 RepID=A0AAD7URD3_9STRA|nr:hypothetical protein CTAYLR_001113 [Chrysophaeum taylorii]